MASAKRPGYLLLPTGSDDDGKKTFKNAASSEWPFKAVAVLLEIYEKKFTAGHGSLRGKDWEEVMSKVNLECQAFNMSKTIRQCRDKVDSLKRRYKTEKRKAVNGNEVSWPFFNKLDEMMGLVFKQAKGFNHFDMRQKSAIYFNHGDDEEDEDDEEHSKEDFSDSPRKFCALGSKRYGSHHYMDHGSHHHMDFLKDGKAKAVERGTLSEDGIIRNHPSKMPLKFLTDSRPEASTEKSSEEDRTFRSPQPGIASKSYPPKRRKEADNPIQALADAIAGFSDVYARVELAKLEIMTTMKLELAKHRRKRRRKLCSGKDEENSHSSSSG